MEYITMCLDNTNTGTGTSGTTMFIFYICGLHVSTYTQVIFRSSCRCDVNTTQKEPSRHNAYAKFPEQPTGANRNHSTNISIGSSATRRANRRFQYVGDEPQKVRNKNYGVTEEHTSYTW